MVSNSPKGRVAQAVSLVHPNASIEVRGTRVKGRFGGYFLAEVIVNGNTVSRARHKDWRTAYKSLEIEFAKNYLD